MKTVSTFIFLLFVLVLLFSCNGKQQIIKQIHQYGDSIGIAKAQILSLEMKSDSIRNIYIEKYPATLFGYTNEDSKARKKFRSDEQAAYKQMVKEILKQDSVTLKDRMRLEVECMIFQAVIDSLKLELNK